MSSARFGLALGVSIASVVGVGCGAKVTSDVVQCGPGTELIDRTCYVVDAGSAGDTSGADGAKPTADGADDSLADSGDDASDAADVPDVFDAVDTSDAPDSSDGGLVLDCTDTLTASPATGSLAVGAAYDYVPLCDGRILLGDRTLNRVVLLDVVKGTALKSYALSAAPHALALDVDRKLLWASLSLATRLARIDLATGTVTDVPISSAVTSVTMGPKGWVFGLSKPSAFKTAVVVYDGAKGKELPSLAIDSAALIVFDPVSSQLFAAERGSSPSALKRYSFVASIPALTLIDTNSTGSNGQDLAVSSDGSHVAFPCGGGSGAGYTIWDFDTSDLKKIFGEWKTGAYPSGAAFSRDGATFGGTDRQSLQLFGVKTHVLLKSFKPTGCSYGDFGRMRFSRGGKLLYGLSGCGFDGDSGLIAWMTP